MKEVLNETAYPDRLDTVKCQTDVILLSFRKAELISILMQMDFKFIQKRKNIEELFCIFGENGKEELSNDFIFCFKNEVFLLIFRKNKLIQI
jgi:hypothetical protein